MADASGTPTTKFSIPTYNTPVDAPSGKGNLSQMQAIDALLATLGISSLVANDVPVYDSVAGKFKKASGTPSSSVFLRGDGTWANAGGAAQSLGLTVSAANTDLAAPAGAVEYMTITTGGGTLRSIGAPPSNGSILTLKNATASSFVRLLHATAGGSGAQLSIINAGHKFLAPGQTIQFVYDGTNWQEINRPSQELICDVLLTGTQATFDTDTILGIASSLPQVYSHLVIESQLRSSLAAQSDTAGMRFNNDSTVNYQQQLLTGDQATVSASNSGVSSVPVALIPGTLTTAGYASGARTEVFNYAQTTFNKVGLTSAYGPYYASGVRNTLWAAAWTNTAAINRIQFISGAGFVAGSRFSLYGIT